MSVPLPPAGGDGVAHRPKLLQDPLRRSVLFLYRHTVRQPLVVHPGEVHRLAAKDRPVAVDGRIEIRPMMYVALSYDHRVIDGQQAVLFLVRIKELMEDPATMLIA